MDRLEDSAQEVTHSLGLAPERTDHSKGILVLSFPFRCRGESESTSAGSLLLHMQRQIDACLSHSIYVSENIVVGCILGCTQIFASTRFLTFQR